PISGGGRQTRARDGDGRGADQQSGRHCGSHLLPAWKRTPRTAHDVSLPGRARSTSHRNRMLHGHSTQRVTGLEVTLRPPTGGLSRTGTMGGVSTERSAALFDRARRVSPGGVNSPVRAFKAVGGTPRFMAQGQGAWLTDVDGNRYVDFVGSWGPMLLGHAHPEVIAAVQQAVARGTSFGTPAEPEVRLAERIVERTSVEQVRLVSSGTEATMSAIRLARGFT